MSLTHLAKKSRHALIHCSKCFWEPEESGGCVALICFHSSALVVSITPFVAIVVSAKVDRDSPWMHGESNELWVFEMDASD